MKSPAELQLRLRRQWDDATSRESRLLAGEGAWPLILSIGRPAPGLVVSDLDAVRHHLDDWRRIEVGEVIWQTFNWRAVANPVQLPVQWKLRQPTEWVRACADQSIQSEFEAMSTFVEQTDPLFHSLLIRQRALWRGRDLNEVVQAARLAMKLTPGCAAGKPLRMLSLEGIDTKFFERNTRLITALLNARYDGEVSRIGLETFLAAVTEGEHWLLVMDLDGSLLPFRKQRVRSSELREVALPGKRLLIVENESCSHHLPEIPEAIAVLGAGFDLSWTNGRWLQEKQIGYWGDIDTWGLQFLADARSTLPHLKALMMSAAIYEQYAEHAVPEPVVAGADPPAGLTGYEKALYKRLLKSSRGRLEQEFLPDRVVQQTLVNWGTR